MAGPLIERDEPQAPTREAGSSERQGRLAALGVALARVAAPIIGKRGSLARLKAHWTAIAGPEWGEASSPLSLGRDGVLKLRATPSAALELQHRAPLLIERVNLYLGREAVTRIALVQGFFQPRAPAPLLRPLGEAEAKALQEKLSGIGDPELRAALARLGVAVHGREE